MKILLDTDIGSDIDDAVCLAYLLAQSRCDLLGITTVTGEAKRRALIARALCQAAGREIPIYPGAEEPLLRDQQQPKSPQAEALSPDEMHFSFPEGEAVEFLRSSVRANPGEILLLTIGPLTNIGLLFSVDPEIPSLLKGMVSMAGVYTEKGLPPTRRGEWNVSCDPHAAAIALEKAPENTRLIGLDVTHRVTMTAVEVERRFTHPLLKRVHDFAKIWFRERDSLTFHDPLAAAVIFNRGICRFESGQVRVELKREGWVGATALLRGGKHHVAVGIDVEGFFKEYFSVFERS